MSISSMLLSLLLFISFSLLPLFSSITIPLSREYLKYQAAASLERAQHHKLYPNVLEQLTPRSYGGYSVSLSFGTPKQTLRFTMDTARSLSWFPCTHNYTCTDCDFPDVDPAHIPTFIPESSRSYKPLGRASPGCEWLFSSSSGHQCKNEHNNSCAYAFQHKGGAGHVVNTTGLLASETLTFLPGGGLSVPNFIVGCSLSSKNMPEGVVGFGRGRVSLPAQMGLKKFSYCMVSHDSNDSSDLALSSNTTEGGRWRGEVQYTPFANNPNVSSHPELLEYYYVGLQNIFVGGVDVKVPAKKYLLAPDAKGHGGTILDSSTILTLMEKPVFVLVFNEFQKQVSNKYTRDKKAENQTGSELCYKVSGAHGYRLNFPQLTLRFVGGVQMVLPLKNYFNYADDSVLCMTILKNGGDDGKVGLGPSIILGNYLQQDYNMEYDLENNQLGIRQQICG